MACELMIQADSTTEPRRTLAVRQRVLSLETHVMHLGEAVDEVDGLCAQRSGAFFCLTNVHQCMMAHDDAAYGRVVNTADCILADGRPIYWVQRLMGHKNASQVRGEDLLTAVCERAVLSHRRVGFYGGATQELADRLANTLVQRYSGLDISYVYAPPFHALNEVENQAVIDGICEAQVDILFVGIGCPKQEVWMAEHRAHLPCVMLGVGAAFDYVSGKSKSAPRLLQVMGMEWFFRLCCEPRRLTSRYLKHNPRFVLAAIKQWLTRVA